MARARRLCCIALSDRARGRIARTLFEDRKREKEPQLYALLGEIAEIAHLIEHRHGVEWHADANANKVFAAAVPDQILSLNPRDSAEVFTEEKIKIDGKIIAESFRLIQELREPRSEAEYLRKPLSAVAPPKKSGRRRLEGKRR